MWKLLKKEIEYFKWLYIFSLLFVIIVNTGITISGRWIEAQDDFPGLRVIWLGVGIVVLFFAVLFNRKSGRLRNYKSLPLTNLEIASVRLLAFLGFWLSLIIILLFFYFLNFQKLPTSDWITNLMSLSGIMFLINSIPILYSDFYSTYFKNSEKILLAIFWSILWVIYILVNTIFITYIDSISPTFFAETRETLKEIYFTSELTIFNIAIGIFLFAYSLYSFRKRKLYLE